jgi:hypothetical protein
MGDIIEFRGRPIAATNNPALVMAWRNAATEYDEGFGACAQLIEYAQEHVQPALVAEAIEQMIEAGSANGNFERGWISALAHLVIEGARLSTLEDV